MLTSNTTNTVTAAISQAATAQDRREAAHDRFIEQRSQIQHLIDHSGERGLEPTEVAGLRRMLAACRQARLVVSAIDLELQRA